MEDMSDREKFLVNPERRNYDILTGLPLRRTFWREADEFVLFDEEEYCLLGIDIENFHLINKWYGRYIGDELLLKIGDFLKKIDRERGSFSGYMGGDNFVTIFKKNDELAEYIGTEIIDIVFKFKGNELFKPFFGAFVTDNKMISVGEMCDYVEAALKMAKENGTQDIYWYDEEQAISSESDVEMMPKIRSGIAGEEFTIFLQPKCALQTGKIVGAEALVRWDSKETGIISPAVFVPLLERNGYISQLDRYVWELTCKTIARWKREGRRLLPISVNVSRVDVATLDVVAIFKELITRYNIPAELLEIEITESAYAEYGALVKDAETELRNAGFKILIDDFGSGYSSLNMLKDVDADVLKLDMKFLDLNSKNNSKGVNIISAVLNMAHHLDLPTIAEGIETEKQLEILEMLGCEFAQGYYFYQPMPIAEFEELLSDDDKIADYSIVSHKRKQDKSYLQEITEYFWKIADVNPYTGDYHFIRNASEPDFISTPRPETIGEYIERYVNSGLIHADDADMYLDVTNLEYVQNSLLKGKKRLRYQLRYLNDGRYVWYTFEITKPASFSKENPWVLFSWKEADDEAASREDTLDIVYNTYLKVLKLNLKTGGFEIIKTIEDERYEDEGNPQNLEEWNNDCINKGIIHPDDINKFVEFMDEKASIKHFDESSEPRQLRFRRKMVDGNFRWVELNLSKSKEYSKDTPIVILYLKQIRYIGEDEELEFDENKKNIAQDIWESSEYNFLINITKNSVRRDENVEAWENETAVYDMSFSEYVSNLADKYVLPEYKNVFRQFLDRNRLISRFYAGHQLESIDYRRMFNEVPTWMRIMVFMYKNMETEDILAKLMIININNIKLQEMELQHKYSNTLTRELENAEFKYKIQAQLYNAYKDPEAINLALGIVAKMIGAASAFIIRANSDNEMEVFNYPKWGDMQKSLLAKHMPASVAEIKENLKGKAARYFYMKDIEEFACLEAIGFRNIVALPVYDSGDVLMGVIGVINATKNVIDEKTLESIAHAFFMALQNMEAYDLINMMGTTDLLTGLKNRNSYEKDLESYFDGSHEKIGCLYIDANGLHELNNTMGHDAGDDLLKTVAAQIIDVFGRDDTYRIGGDEFVVILTDEQTEGVSEKVEEITAVLKDKGYYVSVGFGCTGDMNKFTDVVREAEQQMYDAKREFYKNHGGRRRSDR